MIDKPLAAGLLACSFTLAVMGLFMLLRHNVNGLICWSLACIPDGILELLAHARLAAEYSAGAAALFFWLWKSRGGGGGAKRRLRARIRRLTAVRRTAPRTS